MKIAEIEAKMEQGNCSEEIMELFRIALRRVPQSDRCQHCYTMAVSIPIRYYNQDMSLF